jgi:hypothetical protein
VQRLPECPGKTNLFYFGSTGGGVWKTEDGGSTWNNISDGYFGGSVGSVAVSEADNNVIYVGGGEKTVREMYHTDTGFGNLLMPGKSWEYKGLPNSRHIPRIRIHPKNPDVVFAAVLGDLYKSSDERGFTKVRTVGIPGKKYLFANANAGAIDLVIDPNNYRVLYASTWRVDAGRHTALLQEAKGQDSGKAPMKAPPGKNLIQ